MRNFLNPESVDENTKLLLINALRFKSDWAEKFDSKTEKQPFQGIKSTVETMIGQFENVGYFKTPTGTQMLSLPFSDPNFEMVLILPKNDGEYFSSQTLKIISLKKNIPDFNQVLNEELESLMPKVVEPERLQKTAATITLPKFKIKQKFELKNQLQKVPLLFS